LSKPENLGFFPTVAGILALVKLTRQTEFDLMQPLAALT
jgi:hypothetical protein